MKTVVKKILFMFLLVAGLSFTSMGQKGDDQKKPPPPKGRNTPVINPREKPPRENPKGGDKPKKPGGGEAFVLISLKKEDLA